MTTEAISGCPVCDEEVDVEQEGYRDEDKLHHLYVEDRLKRYEIADLFNCSGSTIQNWLTKYGISRKYQYKIPEDELFHKYKDQRMSISEVASEYGCSDTVIRNRLINYGISLRDTGDVYLDPDQSTDFRDEDELRRLYFDEKKSKSLIAEHFGISVGTVQYWMDKHDIQSRDLNKAQTDRWNRKSRSYRDEDVLRHLYWEDGMNQRDIADHFEVSQYAISCSMDDNDIDVRHTGQHGEFFETDRGEFVRSSGEKKIANWLFSKGFDYEYEPDCDWVSSVPDFHVGDDYVEYWGLVAAEWYQERMADKKTQYEDAGIDIIEIYPKDLDDLASIFDDKDYQDGELPHD